MVSLSLIACLLPVSTLFVSHILLYTSPTYNMDVSVYVTWLSTYSPCNTISYDPEILSKLSTIWVNFNVTVTV